MIREFDFEDWEEELKEKIIISSFKPKENFEQQIYKRMFLLLNHYKIDRNNQNKWFYLSLVLANDFIPCFDLGDAFDGSEPYSEDGLIFYAEIREIINNSPEEISIKEALAQYSYRQNREPNIESLNTKYHRIASKNRMIKYHFQFAEKYYADKDIENKDKLIQKYADETVIELAKNLKELKEERKKYREKEKMKRVKFVAIPNS